MTAGRSARIRVGNAFKDFYFRTEDDGSVDARFESALAEAESLASEESSPTETFRRIPDAFSKFGFVLIAK